MEIFLALIVLIGVFFILKWAYRGTVIIFQRHDTILVILYIYGELLRDIFPYLSDHLLKYLNFVD